MSHFRILFVASLSGLLYVSCAGCSDPGPGAAYYGDQGGEKVLSAEGNAKYPLRARKDQPFFKLKNFRKGERRFGRESLSVDWEESKSGERSGRIFMVVKPSGEDSQEVSMHLAPHEKEGTISLEVAFGRGSMADVPDNVELYLAIRPYGLNDLTFKLSNSVTLGWTSSTYARNWTQEEIDRISKVIGPAQSPAGGVVSNSAPSGSLPVTPSTSSPELSAEIGEETEWVGNTSGGSPQRRGDKDKPLLGFNYAMGDWAGGPCLSRLIPIYSTNPPADNEKQVLAKPDYVVAGLNVHADQVVRGVEVVFMKRKADGTLDSTESYQSDLAGAKAASPKKLGGDGRKMLGVHVRQGLIIDAVAGIMEAPAKVSKPDAANEKSHN